MEYPRITLRSLILRAYNADESTVAGGPKWVGTDQFRVLVKAPDGGPKDVGSLRQMLQSLLTDRFKLTVHRESRNMKVLFLLVGSDGLKIQPSVPGRKGRWGTGPRRIVALAQPLSILARELGHLFERPVIDQTGAQGLFDFNLEFAPLQGDPSSTGTEASIFSALGNLGLRLQNGSAPVEVVVIDSAEKPVAN